MLLPFDPSAGVPATDDLLCGIDFVPQVLADLFLLEPLWGWDELTHPKDTLPARSNHGSPERSSALNAARNEHHLVRWPVRRVNPSASETAAPGVLRVRFYLTMPQGFHGTGVTPCSVKPNRCPPVWKIGVALHDR